MPVRKASSANPEDVFLNIPFDESYERLYLALIAGLTTIGLTPRSVLEIPPVQDPGSVPFSVHGWVRRLPGCRPQVHSNAGPAELIEGLQPRGDLRQAHDFWFRGGFPEPWMNSGEEFRTRCSYPPSEEQGTGPERTGGPLGPGSTKR